MGLLAILYYITDLDSLFSSLSMAPASSQQLFHSLTFLSSGAPCPGWGPDGSGGEFIQVFLPLSLSDSCCWPLHLHRTGKGRPPPTSSCSSPHANQWRHGGWWQALLFPNTQVLPLFIMPVAVNGWSPFTCLESVGYFFHLLLFIFLSFFLFFTCIAFS